MSSQLMPEKVTKTIEEIATELIKKEGLPPEHCCSEIIKRKLTKFSISTVRRYCPRQFKNPDSNYIKAQVRCSLGHKLLRVCYRDDNKHSDVTNIPNMFFDKVCKEFFLFTGTLHLRRLYKK